MRERVRRSLARDVTAPRWVAFLWFVRDVVVVGGAILVAVLWWQAATRDEEADRNARIQACTSGYAATTSAWDARVLSLDEQAEALFAEVIVQAAQSDDVDPALLDRYQSTTDQAAAAAEKVDDMARRRIGLASYAARSVVAGNAFECPPLPARLMVEGIDP